MVSLFNLVEKIYGRPLRKVEASVLQANLEDWAETHYEMSYRLEHNAQMQDLDDDNDQSIIAKKWRECGTGGMMELAFEFTNEFQEKYRGVEWGEEMDFQTKIEEFLFEKSN